MFAAKAMHCTGIAYKQFRHYACRPEPTKTSKFMEPTKPALKMQLSMLVFNLLIAGSAVAATVGGYPFDDSIRMQGKELRLNGAGVRYKAIFSVYSAGLYLGEKHKQPAEIYAVPGPKRMRIVMLRGVNADDFGQAFLAGIEQNVDKAERARLADPLARFGQLFSAIPELKKGDALAIDFLPGQGTTVSINGRQVGEVIAEPAFYTVLLKIWLGERPADTRLRSALLGEGDGA